MPKLRVTVDGTVFEVTVEVPNEAAPAPASAPAPAPAPAAQPVAAPAPAAPSAPQGPGDARSPLAGKVVSIDVELGQAVAEGALVATLEAMKMNTYVNAPRAGKVVSIGVKAGDSVEEGATLLVIG